VARWPVGGIRTHLAYNFPAVRAAGYDCTFLAPEDDALRTLRGTLSHLPGAEFVGVPVTGRRCPLWKATRRLLRTGRFCLVHSHGLTAAAHTSLANLGLGVPHAVTLHEPLRDGQFSGLRGRLRRWLLGASLARAGALITVSEDARDNALCHFAALRRRPDRLHTFPNGIEADCYKDFEDIHTTDIRNSLSLDPPTRLVGYLGRFMPEKGFPLLIDAVSRLAGQQGCPPFHVIAFGSGDYRREYQRAIDECGLRSSFTLRDFVPDVRPVLRQLDLVVVPSLWEASSLVSMEAMCAGVPALGSDCPGLREVLRGTPARTFPAGDSDALACGLENALANPWTGAARAFAPAARERFDNRRSARRLVELYDALLHHPRLSSARIDA
jgi:glycosyltransferase involved in cell wall biosynthesis